MTRRKGESGSALLAVMWLSVALASIAFSVAMTVRAETERTANLSDSTRAYYLAAGSIDRAILWILRGPPQYTPPMPYITMDYPGGQAVVEVIPETSKLGINEATAEDLTRLIAAAGADPGQARYIAEGIIDWRTPGAAGAGGQQYLGGNPSFRPRHASFEEIEELLLVRGMTPELFYGSYFEGQDGRLIPRGGLKDCLSVWGPTTQFDANTADPVLLISLGMTPQSAFEAARVRRVKAFRGVGDFAFGPAAGRLRIGGNVIWTLRATARVRISQGRLSELSRTVSATVKFLRPEDYNPPYHFLRWYGDAWAPGAAKPFDVQPGGPLPGILTPGTPQ